MPRTLTCLTIFIASPGGLDEERKAFRDEIQQYNDSEAIPRGVYFKPVGWEDTLGGVGRPQSIINEDIEESDYFVLVLANRWGSPPDTYAEQPFTSGTEEEYHVAMKCYEDPQRPMKGLVMMFKAVDPQQLSDPGPQLQKVLEFKKHIEIQKRHLFHTFDTTQRFRECLRKHLAKWLRDHEHGSNAADAELEQELTESSIGSLAEIGHVEASGQLSPMEISIVEKAWRLADEGRLTEAEVEFARLVVGNNKPEALASYGRFLYRVGRLDQARILFEGSGRLAEEQGNSAGVATANNNLGLLLMDRGDLNGAEEMLRKSLEVEERLGKLEGMAASYNNLGLLLVKRGDLNGAEEMYRKSLEISEKLGDMGGIARAYTNLGNLLMNRGDLDRVEEMLRKSLEISDKLGNLEGMASAYGNLGLLLMDRGDLDGAEEMYRKSLEIEERLGRLEVMAADYNNLGFLLIDRGDLQGAKEMHRKLLVTAELLESSELTSRASILLDVIKSSIQESSSSD